MSVLNNELTHTCEYEAELKAEAAFNMNNNALGVYNDCSKCEYNSKDLRDALKAGASSDLRLKVGRYYVELPSRGAATVVRGQTRYSHVYAAAWGARNPQELQKLLQRWARGETIDPPIRFFRTGSLPSRRRTADMRVALAVMARKAERDANR